MKNLTIRRGLSALFVFLFGILVVMSIVATLGLMNVNDSLKTVYEDRLVCIGQQDQVIRLLERNHYLFARALLDDEGKMGEYRTQILANENEAKRIWETYLSTFIVAEERKLIDAYTTTFSEYERKIASPARLALTQGDRAMLQAVFNHESELIFSTLRQRMSELIQLQLQIGEAEFLKSQQNFTRINILTIVILVSALVLIAMAARWLTVHLSKPLAHAVQLADKVAHGDLTQVIVSQSKTETGLLINALAKMNFGLLDIVSQLRSGANSIEAATSDLARGHHDLSQRTEEQASSLEETASAMEELTVAVQNNAENAQVANQLVGQATQSAVDGGRVVDDVVATMNVIKERSRKIVDIIAVIDGIAFQTNILALNAAVEAARAGEQGRGFAVVATEVRNLAQRSAQAAKEIKHLITESVETVEQGDRLAASAGATMQQVVTSIKQVADLMAEIAAASTQQRAGIEQINGAIGEMDHVTQQNTALVEEATAATEAMRDQVTVFLELVARFKTNQTVSEKTISAGTLRTQTYSIASAPRLHRS